MKLHHIFIPLTLFASVTTSENEELLHFPTLSSILNHNGWLCVGASFHPTGFLTPFNITNMLKTFSQQSIEVSLVTSNGNSPFHLFVLETVSDLEQPLKLALERKPGTSVIYIVQGLSDTEIEVMDQTLSKVVLEMKANALVYVCYSNLNEALNKPKVFQIISTPRFSSLVKNEVFFMPTSYRFQESYDLQGELITSISTDYPPFIVFQCPMENKNCYDGFGNFVSIFDHLANMFNFSYSNFREPTANWGTLPLDNGNFANGTFTGVFGGVVNNEYDLSICDWLGLPERELRVDFLLVETTPRVLAVTPQPPEIDYELFLRPFTTTAWLCIAGLLLLVLTAIVIPVLLYPSFENTDGFLIAATSAWVFFSLVNAYYGGAMTMFFTAEFSFPFLGVNEAISAYPSWKLLMLKGNDVFFFGPAEAGDLDFKQFYQRTKSNPVESVADGLLDGLRKMETERGVLEVQKRALAYTFQSNPSITQDVLIQPRKDLFWANMPFTKNSPLVPILQRGITRLRDSGILERIALEWGGSRIPTPSTGDQQRLSAGQTVLVYFLIGSACIFSIFCLLLECVIKKIADYSREKQKPHFQKVLRTKADSVKQKQPQLQKILHIGTRGNFVEK